MSNALAIAAVTAVLRDLLNNGVVQHDLSSNVGVVSVTCQAARCDQHRAERGRGVSTCTSTR